MRANVCRDFGRPGCLGTPDPAFTMNFDDIGEAPILWCSWCGPQTQAITKAINKAFAERPNFAADFEKAIKDAVARQPTIELGTGDRS